MNRNEIAPALTSVVYIPATTVQVGMMHNTFSKVANVEVTDSEVIIVLRNGSTYRHPHADRVRVLSGWLD